MKILKKQHSRPKANSSTDNNQYQSTKCITNVNHNHEFETNNVLNLNPELSKGFKNNKEWSHVQPQVMY